MELDPEDREKTAFTMHIALYEFNVMPFGLCNTPSTFQRLKKLILAGLWWSMCLINLDDVITLGRTSSVGKLQFPEACFVLSTFHCKLCEYSCTSTPADEEQAI